MGSLNEGIVFDSFNLEIDLQRKAIHFGRMSQNYRRMNLGLGGSIPFTRLACHKLKGAQKARWETRLTRAQSSLADAERGLTSISHGEELFGILAVPLSTDALRGRQLQAQRDIAVRFNGAVTTLSDGGSVRDVLVTGLVGCASPETVFHSQACL